MRRLVDFVLALALGIVTAPLVLALAVGVAVAFRAWPFFTQLRVGVNGETMRFVKLRTLPTATPPYADKYAIQAIDPPAFAQLLRRFHLDELPQLYLVLLGRLSLVGPRPEMPTLHAEMPARFADTRVTVRPGCTGLWQISADCSRLILEAPEYDLFYIAHRSVRLDLWILWRTIFKVLGVGEGIKLSDVPAWVLGRRSRPEPFDEVALVPARD